MTSGRASRRSWLRLGRSSLVAAVAVTVTAISSIQGTESAQVISRATTQSLSTAPLIGVGLNTAASSAPQNYTVTGLTPGSFVDKLANLRNDGTTPPKIEIGITTATATALDTDSSKGLTFQIDVCSVMWTQSAPGVSASCNGTTSTVFGPTSIASAASSSPSAELTSGLAAFGTAGVDHLRVRIALPAAAPGSYTSLSSQPTLTIWGATVPDAPVVTANPGDGQLSPSWVPPNSYNFPIVSYNVTLSTGGSQINSCTTTTQLTCMFTGLTNGVAYTVAVTATTSRGTSAAGTVVGYPFPAILTGGNRVLWLDGTDLSTMFKGTTTASGNVTASGQTVGLWKDKSGASNDMVAPNQLAASDSTVFGKMALATTASKYLQKQTGFPVNSDYSIITVYDQTTSCTGNILSGNKSGTNDHAYYTNGTTGLSIFQNGNPRATASGNAGAMLNTKYIGAGTVAGTVATVNVNAVGTTVGTGTVANQVISPYDGITVGAWQTPGGNQFCGSIAEVIVLSKAVSASELRTIQDYLGRKWGITLAPTTPTGATASAGTTSGSVSWTAPTYDGGAGVTGYTVTSTPGSKTCTTTGATSCTVSGLTTGTAYTFAVRATNSAGASLSSAASNSITAG